MKHSFSNHVLIRYVGLLFLPMLLTGISPIQGRAQIAFSEEQPTLIFYELRVLGGPGQIRDFATSPLFYEGTMSGLSVSRLKRDHARETAYGGEHLRGILSAEVDDRNVGSSGFQSYHLFFKKLYQISGLSSEEWNLKAGGAIDINGNLRTNPSFQNNNSGLEIIFTLSASAKVTHDISRTERTKGRFLFINYDYRPRVRTLSFQMDFGFFNNNFRNGYIYTNPSPIFNDPKFFYDYEFNFFSGLRFGYDLDYTLYNRNNHNAFVIGVTLDAYTTGADYEKFQALSSSLNFAFLFNSKTK